MRIKTQFVLNTLLFGIILVFMTVSAIITNQQVETTREQESIAANIAQGASDLSYLANDYLIYRESQQLSRWQSRFVSFSALTSSLNVARPDQQVLVRNIQTNQKRLKEVFDSTVSAAGGSSANQKIGLDPALLQVSWSRIAIQSQGLISDASRLSQLLRQQMDNLMNRRSLLIYLMTGLFGAFLFASYMLTYQRILKSLAKVQAGTASIGSGNFDFKFADEKNDEIGDLSRAFNQMTADLKTVTASKADLEHEIAERKQAEEELRRSEERYRTLFEAMTEGFAVHEIVCDEQGRPCDYRFLDVNPAFERLTGLKRADLLNRCVRDVLPGTEAHWIESYGKVALTGEPVHFENFSASLDRWYEVFAYRPVVNQFAVLFTDITERKRTEEDLRKAHDELEKRVQERTIEISKAVQSLQDEIVQRKRLEATLRESENQVRFFASQCLTAQESERKRIAGELHDSISASLAATKFGIERASEEMKRGHGDPESLKNLAASLTGIITEVRRIMADLRPSILDDLGILAALNWFCREYQKAYSHISVERQIGIEEHEVPDSLKTPVFRISQEAMNNISKHSQASLVRLSLKKEDGRMLLTIHDNGQGFDPETVRKGLGLSSIRERAELSGGACSIESVKGAGTTVCCSWPI